MSIRKKLIILFLAIAIIPLFFVSILAFSNTRKALHEQQLEKLEAIADLKVDKIERFFHERISNIKTAQNYFNIKANLPILTRFADDRPNADFAAAKKKLDGQLKAFREVYNYEDIMLVNPEGKIIYVTNDAHEAKDIGNTLPDPKGRAFEEGKKGVFLSDIYMNKERGADFEMLITAPVHDFEEKFIGVIAFQTDMAAIYKFIQDTTGLGKTGETLIGKRIGDEVVFLNSLRHNPEAALKRRVLIGSEEAIPIQEAVQKKEGYGLSVDYRDKEIIAVWRYIPSLDWGLVAKIDTKEAFASVIFLRNMLIGILSIILILVTIAAFVSAKSISDPIITLTNASKSLASGDLSQKVDIQLKDEIGSLANSFNIMAESLSSSRNELISAKDYTDNIIRSMTDTLIVISPDGHIETVNKAACTILGYEKKELIGQPFGKVISEEEEEEEEEEVFRGTKLAELVEKGSIVNMDVTYRAKDGRNIPMSLTGSAMRDKDGKLTGIVAAARDMREIQKFIAELRTSRAYSEGIVTTIPSGLAALDEEGRVLSTNPGFTALFKEKLPIGKRLYDLVPSLELKNAIDKVFIEGGDVRNLEISQELREGSNITLNVSVAGLRIAEEEEEEEEDTQKKPIDVKEKEHRAKVLVVFDDITERKRLTRELEHSIEDLKRTQAQLVQSGKLSAVGELAAGVAHEINNPLSGVLTYAILLKEKFDCASETIRSQFPKFSEQLDMIKTAAERCKSISDNLLSFSRQSEADMSSVDISDVISKTFELIGAQLRHKRIKLNREIQNGLPSIKGDANQLQQVFTNVVLNAVYFIDQEGEICVKAVTGDRYSVIGNQKPVIKNRLSVIGNKLPNRLPVTDDRSLITDHRLPYFVEISISDTGPGIPREHLDRIFDPFFTTKPIGKGTGLGLSIAYGIIRNHNGEIMVNSLLGRGTTFVIKLPVVGNQ